MKAIVVTMASVMVAVVAASAQAQPKDDAEQVKSRQRISMMEGVLERAVSNGAENLLRQVKTVMPDMPMLTGVPQVRGFRLEGYGVFFDVEVPALRLPLTWTLRYMVDDSRVATSAAIAELRVLVSAQQTTPDRDRLSRQIDRIEESVASPQAQSRPVNPAVVDPNDAYTRAVKEALMDAMIENSGAMTLGADEWLTVAARDNVPRDPLIPGDAVELNTLIFRIKGADLAAFRGGRVTLDEARKRIDIRER